MGHLTYVWTAVAYAAPVLSEPGLAEALAKRMCDFGYCRLATTVRTSTYYSLPFEPYFIAVSILPMSLILLTRRPSLTLVCQGWFRC